MNGGGEFLSDGLEGIKAGKAPRGGSRKEKKKNAHSGTDSNRPPRYAGGKLKTKGLLKPKRLVHARKTECSLEKDDLE